MTLNIRQVEPTQYLAANTSNQVLTFASTGLLLVTAIGNTCYLATGSANTVDASTGIPVLSNVQVLIQTGQQYNNTPGNVYVSVISSTGTANVYVTPVSV